jgi:ADP-dependent NAD(P)H-hydrate dehydratase / NAD(P)H-hydrate epimerase
MRRIPNASTTPLHDTRSSRLIERVALAGHPSHHLMSLAGASVARLAQAIAPHARTIWVACGPGNNGGDGLMAATNLLRSTGGRTRVVATLCADPERLPADAARALEMAQNAGVHLRQPEGRLHEHLQRLQQSTAPVVCVDLPSGLEADSGRYWAGSLKHPLPGVRHTLSVLTVKPGLFTADGRDQAGTVWFDGLGIDAEQIAPRTATLWSPSRSPASDPHAAHKGSRGEVVVIGGQDISIDGAGMTGASLLAARASLHGGAGRVYLSLLGATQHSPSVTWDPTTPELMFRSWTNLETGSLIDRACVVCGCGGGSAVGTVMPTVLARAQTLVLDADALNCLAADATLQAALIQRHARRLCSVLTPHPLEAARLLGTSTAEVMADRLAAARQLSERFKSICVLKGSGTVVCAPGEVPIINSSGSASLATAGTGDVLAGMIGAEMAGISPPDAPVTAVLMAVFQHGRLADQWASGNLIQRPRLTANALATCAGSA